MPVEPAIILERLRSMKHRLAVAESFTGGLLIDAFVRVPGASDVLAGGLVAYADDAKSHLLSVPLQALRSHGAVSSATAVAMAEGALGAFGAQYAVSTTGISGPKGATRAKPVGLSICAAVGPAGHAVTERVHEGGRDAVRRAGVAQALETLAGLL